MNLHLAGLCVVVIILSIKTINSTIHDGLETHSIIYGIALTAANRNSTAQSLCEKQLTMLEKGVQNLDRWAIKLMDASGVPSSGLYWGNTFWLGSKKQCLYSVSTKQIAVSAQIGRVTNETSDSIPPFYVDYYAAYFNHSSTMQVLRHWRNETTITIGLCLPTSCQETEVGSLLQEYFDSGVLYHQRLYNMSLQLESVKKVADDYSWLSSTKFIVALAFFGVFLVMCLLGTCYDLFMPRPLLENKSTEIEIAELTGNQNSDGVNNHVPKPACETQTCMKQSRTEKIFTAAKGFLLSFSFRINARDILYGNNANRLKAIEGIRVITTGYIVYLHSVVFRADQVDNAISVFYITDNIISKSISNADNNYVVDTFFTISGFLLAHLLLKEYSKKPSAGESFLNMFFSFWIRVTKRFLRLTPAYMASLLFTDMISTWRYRDTAFWSGEKNEILCSKYWWRNLLYINNFYPKDEMYMYWSWYLSNDMQFYVLSLAVLLISISYFKIAAGLLGSILTASCIYTAYIVYTMKMLPMFDMMNAASDVLYTPPWVRVCPYIVGVGAGYVLYLLKGKLSVNKYVLWLLWAIGIFFNLITLFGVPDRRISLTESIFYITFGKQVWSIGISWIIIACATNNGGWFQKFLSMEFWSPLSKISYCTYLVNPTIIYSITTHNEKAWQVGTTTTILFGVAYIVISFIGGFCFSVLIELPIIRLVKLFCESETKQLPAVLKTGQTP